MQEFTLEEETDPEVLKAVSLQVQPTAAPVAQPSEILFEEETDPEVLKAISSQAQPVAQPTPAPVAQPTPTAVAQPTATAKRSLGPQLAETLKQTGLYPSATSAIATGKYNDIRRKESGDWELPFMAATTKEGGVKEQFVTVGAALEQTFGGKLRDTWMTDSQPVQKVFHDFQQANNLSDEEMNGAWNDFWRMTKAWDKDEKVRLFSDGRIRLNPMSTDYFDDQKVQETLDKSGVSEAAKQEFKAGLRENRYQTAAEKIFAYETAMGVLSSPTRKQSSWGIDDSTAVGAFLTMGEIPTPSKYAEQKGYSAAVLNTPEFLREYETQVIDKQGAAGKWARGLATDAILGFNKVATTGLGIGGLAGSEGMAQAAAAGSEAGGIVSQGKTDTGIAGAIVQELPSLASQIVASQLTGGLSLAATGGRAAGAIGLTTTLATAGAQSAGMTYADQRAQGATDDEARSKALKAGLNTAVITGIFQGLGAGGVERAASVATPAASITLRDVISAGTRQEVWTATRQFVKQVMVDTLGEASEEAIDTFTGSLLAADPDTDLGTLWGDTWEAAKIGGALGGAVGVASNITGKSAPLLTPDVQQNAPQAAQAALDTPVTGFEPLQGQAGVIGLDGKPIPMSGTTPRRVGGKLDAGKFTQSPIAGRLRTPKPEPTPTPTPTPTPAQEIPENAQEQTTEKGAKFYIGKTKGGRDKTVWTQTRWGKKVGDAYDPGDAGKVAFADQKHTEGMPEEYVVWEYKAILDGDKAEVEIASRDMTPAEIAAKQDKLRRSNEMAKELGIKETPIPEIPAQLAPAPAPAAPAPAPAAPAPTANQTAATASEQKILEDAAYAEANTWDMANRGKRSDEWFDGGNADADAIQGYRDSEAAGGMQLQAHGMAKESTLSGGVRNLLGLLRSGLDPNRRGGKLDTAPLVIDAESAKAGAGGITASGTAYRDGPFTLVARPGQNLSGDLSGLGAVVINQANAAQAEAIKVAILAVRPDVLVGTVSELGDITKKLFSQETAPAAPAPLTPTQQDNATTTRNIEPDNQQEYQPTGEGGTPAETGNRNIPVESGTQQEAQTGTGTLNREELKATFDLTDEQAEVAESIARAMGLTPEQVLLAREKAKAPEPTPEPEPEPEPEPAQQTATTSDFSNPDTYYRVVVGDAAFDDIVKTGQVRTNAESKGGTTLAERMAARPTAFPSFSKGQASMDYASANPNHYIITSQDPSIQPSTQGRHGKGTTMFPTDSEGKPQKTLDGNKVNVYKHVGNGNYELVYANGKPVAPAPAPAPTPRRVGGRLDAGRFTQSPIAGRLRTPKTPEPAPEPTPEPTPAPRRVGGRLDAGRFTQSPIAGRLRTPKTPAPEPTPAPVEAPIKLRGTSSKVRTAAKDIRETLGVPLNPDFEKEIELDSGVTVEIDSFGDFVTLTGLKTPKESRGKGLATQALKEIVSLAGDAGVPIRIVAEPFGDDGMNKAQLIDWYSKNGFALQADGETMIYTPTQTEAPAPEPTPETATLTFPSREAAQAFATAWGRHSTRGHGMSKTGADGVTSVTVDGVTEKDKAWIDSYVNAPTQTEAPASVVSIAAMNAVTQREAEAMSPSRAEADGAFVIYYKSGIPVAKFKSGNGRASETIAEAFNRNPQKAAEDAIKSLSEEAEATESFDQLTSAALRTRKEYHEAQLRKNPNTTPANSAFNQEILVRAAKKAGIEPPDYLKAEWPQIWGKTKPTPAPAPTPTPEPAQPTSLSRGKPRESITFKTPIKTPMGEVLQYSWSSTLIEDIDNQGEPILRRISNWDEAATNAETGRDIVHRFTIRKPDGSVSEVSLESTMGQLTPAEKKSLKSVISAAKRLPFQKAELAELEAKAAEAKADYERVQKLPLPSRSTLGLSEPEFPGPIARGEKQANYGGVFVGNLTPSQIKANGELDLSAPNMGNFWNQAASAWRMAQPRTELTNTESDRIDSLRRSIKKSEKLLADSDVTVGQVTEEAAPAPVEAPAAPEVKLTPIEKRALAISKLKGTELRANGITYVPERVMTLERRKSLLTEEEKAKPFLPSPRGGPNIEVREWAEVTGDPYARGWAIIDRRKPAPTPAPTPTPAPESAQAAPENKWSTIDAITDPADKGLRLEGIASNRFKYKATDQDLIDVLDRLDEATMGSQAWRVAYAVAQNPAASPETKARAETLRENWMRPGRMEAVEPEPEPAPAPEPTTPSKLKVDVFSGREIAAFNSGQLPDGWTSKDKTTLVDPNGKEWTMGNVKDGTFTLSDGDASFSFTKTTTEGLPQGRTRVDVLTRGASKLGKVIEVNDVSDTAVIEIDGVPTTYRSDLKGNNWERIEGDVEVQKFRKRSISRAQRIFEESPLFINLKSEGGVMSMTFAKKIKGKKWFEANKSQWDGTKNLPQDPRFTSFFAYSEFASTPDVLADNLYNEGKLPSSSPNSLWDEIVKEIASARKTAATEKEIAQNLEQDEDFARATSDGKYRLILEKLSEGDVLFIDGVEVIVDKIIRNRNGQLIRIDFDGDKRFGNPTIKAEDEFLYVDDYFDNYEFTPDEGIEDEAIYGAAEDFTLESVTQDQLDEEAAAQNQRGQIADRQAQRLTGDAGIIVPDMFGTTEGQTPLFNEVWANKPVITDIPVESKTSESGQKYEIILVDSKPETRSEMSGDMKRAIIQKMRGLSPDQTPLQAYFESSDQEPVVLVDPETDVTVIDTAESVVVEPDGTQLPVRANETIAAQADTNLSDADKRAYSAFIGAANWTSEVASRFAKDFADFVMGAKFPSAISEIFSKFMVSLKASLIAGASFFSMTNFVGQELTLAEPVTTQVATAEVKKFSVINPQKIKDGTYIDSLLDIYAAPQPPRYDENAESVSVHDEIKNDAQIVDEFVRETGDNEGKPYIIVSKREGLIRLYDASGNLLHKSTVLLGKSYGDVVTNRNRTMAQTRADDSLKITPSGRYETKTSKSSNYGEVVGLESYNTGTRNAIHRVCTKFVNQKRLTRLAGKLSNRISLGCVNVYSATSKKVNDLMRDGGVVYVTPDSRLTEEFVEDMRQSPVADTNVRYQSDLTAEDEAYFDAIDRGDTETAQRIVDEAAKAAGLVRSRHATGAPDFTVFSREAIPSYDPDTNIRGFHFSTEATPQSSYRYQNSKNNRVLDVFLDLRRTVTRREAQKMVRQGDETDGFPNGFDTVTFLEASGTPTTEQQAMYGRGEPVKLANGFFVVKSSMMSPVDGKMYEGADLFHESDPEEFITGYSDLEDAFAMHNESHVVVRDSSQIKSADPIVKDDNGDIIPPSQRFNPESDDIRYQSDRDTTSLTAANIIALARELDAADFNANVKDAKAFIKRSAAEGINWSPVTQADQITLAAQKTLVKYADKDPRAMRMLDGYGEDQFSRLRAAPLLSDRARSEMDEGDIIPPSQRFNPLSQDIRHQRRRRRQKAKGSAQLLEDGKVLLKGLENPDFTTAVHEMAHAFEMTGYTGLTDEEVTTLKTWAGDKNPNDRKMMERTASEKFARGWERYLADGKAPFAELQAIFDKIQKWMLETYKTITGTPLDVEISPEVRAIFDKIAARMVAPSTIVTPSGSMMTTEDGSPLPPAVDPATIETIETDDQLVGVARFHLENPLPPPPALTQRVFNTPEDEPLPYSLQRARADMEAALYGYDTVAWNQAARTFGNLWDRVVNEPAGTGEAELDKLMMSGNPDRPLSDLEVARFTHEGLKRKMVLDRTLRELQTAISSGNQKMVEEKQNLVNAASARYQTMLNQIARSRTAAGRALNAWKYALQEDFSQGTLYSRALVNYNSVRVAEGKPAADALPEAEAKAVAQFAERMAKMQEEIDALKEAQQLGNDRAAEQQAMIDALRAERAAVKSKKSSKVQEVTRRVLVDKVRKAAKEARERLGLPPLDNNIRFQMDSANDPTWYDRVIVLAEVLVANPLMGTAQFADRVRVLFGAAYAAVSGNLRNDVEEYLRPMTEDVSGEEMPTPQMVMESIDGSEELTNQMVYDLAKAHVYDGARDTEVLDRVFRDLLEFYPDLTREDVAQLFTRYGETRAMNKSEEAKALRAAKSLELVQRQIDNLLTDGVMKRTGTKKDDPDVKLRELRKKRDDLAKDLGYVPVDPETQLSSAQTAAKKRMKNEMEELDRAIKSNTPIVRVKRGVRYTEDMEQMRSNLEELRKAYADIFGQQRTPAERMNAVIKDLDRRIAKERELINKGILKEEVSQPAALDSPEISARRELLKELKRQKYEAYDALHPNERALDQAMKAAQKALERRQKIINEGLPAAKDKPARDANVTPTAELEALWEAADDMDVLIREMRKNRPLTPAQQLRQLDDAYDVAVRTREVLRKRIADGDLVPASGVKPTVEDRTRRVREENAELRKQITQMQRDAGVGVFAYDVREAKKVAALEKSIEELRRKRSIKDFSKRKTTEPVTSERIRTLELIKDNERREYEQARAMAVFKTLGLSSKALEYAMASWHARQLFNLAGDFGVFNRQLGKMQLFALWQDVKAIFRRGRGVKLADDTIIGKTLAKGFEAFMDEKVEGRIYSEMATDPSYALKKANGFDLVSPHESSHEISADGRVRVNPMFLFNDRVIASLAIIKGIVKTGAAVALLPMTGGATWKTILKGAGETVVSTALAVGGARFAKRVERANRVIINVARWGLVDAAMKIAGNVDPSVNPDYSRIVTEAMMTYTGKVAGQSGFSKGMKNNSYWLGIIFSFPQYVVTNMQSVVGIPLWSAIYQSAAKRPEGQAFRPQAIAAVAALQAQYYLGTSAKILFWAMLLGVWDEEDTETEFGVVLNPKHPYFGCLKLGKTFIDLNPRANKWISDLSRMFGTTKLNERALKDGYLIPDESSSYDKTEMLQKFAYSQINMNWKTLADLSIKGELYKGGELGRMGALQRTDVILTEIAANLTARDVQKMYEVHGPVTGSVLSGMIMGGANVSVRETESERGMRKAEERRRYKPEYQ